LHYRYPAIYNICILRTGNFSLWSC